MDRDGRNRTDGSKRPGWPKAVDLALRSCHIGISSVLFGGLVLDIPYARLSNWHGLAIATGSALIMFNIFKCRHWPYQGRGVMAWLHVGLIGLAHFWLEQMIPILATALAVGVVGSHMPGFLRHWSFVHRRRIE